MNVPVNQYRQSYLLSEDAEFARSELQLMLENPGYNTRTMYSPSPEGSLSFIEEHLKFLSLHPKLNTHDYIANLRLKTKVR